MPIRKVGGGGVQTPRDPLKDRKSNETVRPEDRSQPPGPPNRRQDYAGPKQRFRATVDRRFQERKKRTRPKNDKASKEKSSTLMMYWKRYKRYMLAAAGILIAVIWWNYA